MMRGSENESESEEVDATDTMRGLTCDGRGHAVKSDVNGG